MASIERTLSGAPWEKMVGYCRAIKVGPHIAVSGTAPIGDDGKVQSPGDPFRQALRCFEIIERSLQELGAGRRNIVRTRMLVTDISQWKEFGRAHAEYFGSHPPASTLVEVSALIDPLILIEVEADAVVIQE